MTIKDIAKLAGVSVSTVSRAINDDAEISKSTKKHILEIIKKTGYIPNNSARNLKRIENDSIAVIVKSITNIFFNKFIHVFEHAAGQKNYELVLRHVADHDDELKIAEELTKEKRLKGIIFLGGERLDSLEQVSNLSVPFVYCTVNQLEEIKDELSLVTVDDVNESFKVVSHLIELGHKRISIITNKLSRDNASTLRFLGYKKALEAYNLQVDPDLLHFLPENNDSFSLENGYNLTMEVFKKKTPKCSAVFVISDILAIGVIRALKDLGYSVPEDFSVAGFDGIELGQYYTPRLTTIRQPADELAIKSINLLFQMIENKNYRNIEILEGDLIIGESTAKYKMQER